MDSINKEQCELCGEDFSPRWVGQKTCYGCWKSIHKDIRQQHKERLFGALGKKIYSDSKRKNSEREMGSSDDEILPDFFRDAANSNAGLGCEPESKVLNKDSQLVVGQKLRDGAVFCGRFPLKNEVPIAKCARVSAITQVSLRN